MRALRWLKKYQEPGGSWVGNAGGGTRGGKYANAKAAFTGMALLTYLAHGETPASEEFGETVEYAIRFLVEDQMDSGRFKTVDKHEYSHPIAAYAICEAYGLTQVPMLEDAAVKSIKLIIDGQHASGGWNYNLSPGTRDDTSYMGWCAQALKAAKMAGLYIDGLEEACKKSLDGFRKNYQGKDGYTGQFGYTSGKTKPQLTGVGVLCMQLHGQAQSAEVSGGLGWIEKNVNVSWSNPQGGGVYHWYYDTQAVFHRGGPSWDAYNLMFSKELVSKQVVVPKAIMGIDGKMKDIGYWDSGVPDEHTGGRTQDTCLCALQLQVYYRYLPTFQAPNHVVEEKVEMVDKEEDIDIELNI
jgi:hypothetical protein